LLPLSVSEEVALFCVRPFTFVPIAALIVTPPVPLPEFVIVPVLLMVVMDSVMPLAVEPSFFKVRLPVPLKPPETVKLPAWLVKVLPPLLTVKAPVEMVSPEVVLFCVMPVTFAPTPPVMDTPPEPLPELVIVPVLLTAVVDSVMPLDVDPLLLKIKLPVPLTPPVTVKLPAWLVKVVPPLLTVNPPVEMVSPEVVLFCVIPVTLDPTPPTTPIFTLPEPLPELVIVPVLLTVLLMVMPPELAALSVKLLVPVMLPLTTGVKVLLLVSFMEDAFKVIAPVPVSSQFPACEPYVQSPFHV